MQVNPTKHERFEQSAYRDFISVNDRGELAENYGAEGDVAHKAVLSSLAGVRKLASKHREPVYMLITREGKVFKGNEVRPFVSKANTDKQQ